MTNTKTLIAVTAGACLLVVVALTGIHLDIQGAALPSNCLGKPYGWPGCPTKSASSVSATCGNSIVDKPSEECDDGRFNGQTACGDDCRFQQCGDGAVWIAGDEECEAPAEEFYAQDASGNMLIERKYDDTPACGTYCLPPQCNGTVPCFSGCKWYFGPTCQSVSSGGSGTLLQGPPAGSGAVSSKSSSSKSVVASLTCGNGLTETGEECDDGNKIATDGCTNACQLPHCGDGIAQFGEECDDGNPLDTDACSNACKRARCGDALIQAGEECDDGNQDAFDSCTNTCRVPRCGDGVVQIGEECDDGNKTETDSCTNVCKLSMCGDGIAQDGEECDDGNQSNNDACTNVCKAPRCGDGFRQSGEQCDDGNQNDADSCTTLCGFAKCGNGVTEGPEECDDGNQNGGDACSNACRRPRCGDGIVSYNEECDAGKDNSNMIPDACRLSCRKPFCGDFIVDAGEECDGSTVCEDTCKLRADIIQPAGDVGGPGLSGGQIGVIASALVAGVLAIAGVIYRKALMKFLQRLAKKGPNSIEDIPLDQIEMPWHKW